MQQPIVKVENLKKWFKVGGGYVYAVNGIDFEVYPGEAVALVGESGCGKSTTARCLVRLYEPTDGKMYFQGKDISHIKPSEFRPLRKHIQMVFQDPSLSLNPRLSVRSTVSEPLKLHHLVKSPKELNDRLHEMISLVNLEMKHLDRKPGQLSGGQKQRVGIARAIATNPDFVVLDEPTSSLDMSVRIHVVELLKRLQKELGMTYIFISHDLSTVRYLCNRVMVMYLGRIVESGPVAEIFDNPAHMYTEALLSAIPIPDPDVKRDRIILPGETPSLTTMFKGCPLQDRCPNVLDKCRTEDQQLEDIGGGHYVACWRAQEKAQKAALAGSAG